MGSSGRRSATVRLRMTGFLGGIGFAIFSSLAALAVEPAHASSDLIAGAELANSLCARCHAVASGPSPVADAPAFATLSRRWPIEYLAEALAEGIVTSHRGDVEMPEFVLTPEQIDDLLAYLESVQE